MPYGFSQRAWDIAKGQAKDAMIERAKVRGMITYSDLTRKITSIRLNPDSFALAELLREISTDENAAGRGMLTVVVVHKIGDMEPGNGFYELAGQLGKDTMDKTAFWISELHSVHAEWSK